LSGGTLFYQSRVYPVPSQFNQSEPNVLVDGLLSHLKAIAGEGRGSPPAVGDCFVRTD
jgi:hypothetical protein